MDIIKPSLSQKNCINQILATLNAGGLVIMPTETVYGAMVDATNPQAVAKLLEFKKRRLGKAISIAVANQNMAEHYVQLNDQARNLYREFLPGPLTVVSQSNHVLPQVLESEFGTLGVRIPNYPLLLEIIDKFDRPLTATSANLSGKKNPYSIEDILNNLSVKGQNLIDLIVDVGPLPKRPPSLVVDTTLTTPLVIRQNNAFTHPAKLQTIFHSHNETDTFALASRLMMKHFDTLINSGLVIGLNGELGTGKTIFTKGIAQYLNITDVVTSPTYTYQKEYNFDKHQVQGTLYHLDLWTIDKPALWQTLAVSKLVKPHNIVVMEWYSSVAEFSNLKPNIVVTITPNDKEHCREISIYEK